MHKNNPSQRMFTMLVAFIILFALIFPAGMVTPARADGSITATINFTILHTNDFHGQLEKSGSNPGLPSVAFQVKQVQAVIGAQNTLVVDSGDEMQGSLLSNLYHGESTIGAFNAVGYSAATFGNHEFDWGQSVLNDRTNQATYDFVSANIVKNDTGNCSTANWVTPDTFKVVPYVIKTLNTDSGVLKVGIVGVTTMETPIITIASATEGLCFKDPADSIVHYYDEVKSQSDVVVVLSHIGYNDGGYGYGIPVYGDTTLANKLLTAGKYVPLIIGGHSHTNLTTPGVVTVGGMTTYVVQAYYNGRKLGRADLSLDTVTGVATLVWQSISVPVPAANPSDPAGPTEDATVKTIIQGYANNPDYQNLINQPIGYSAVDLPRLGGTVDNMMGTFVDDAIYNYLNTDTEPTNDIDIFFNNAGGIRTDWCWNGTAWVNTGCVPGIHDPALLTYGNMFTILPFGNATVVGDMTGAQILEVLNKGPQVSNGVIQPAGIKYTYYKYTDSNPGPQPFAWGAFDYCVVNKDTQECEPLDLLRTYRVGTNEFLAPGGGDGYGGFKYMTNRSYWGDMLNAVDTYVSATYGITETAYLGPNGDGTLDGRILRDGTNTMGSGSITPITVLHHNDSHGNLTKGTYVGYTQLATLIKQERLHNPTRTLLLQGGDQIQGDAMMYYFKSSYSGFAADGTPLPPDQITNPMIAAMNSMNYDAMTLGNHEFNYGSAVFDGIFQQAQFPLLGANVSDTGEYGLGTVGPGGEGVQPYIEKTLDGINVAILGITNHRVPNYELPSNIIGLTFSNPITTAEAYMPDLRDDNDVVIALTHIGFTTNPKSVEVDNNVDTNLAADVAGIDAIIGSHSHTNPASPEAPYKQLPAFIGGPSNTPVIINQAYRYNNTLGEVILGVRAKPGGGYEVVSRAGQYLSVVMGTVEDAATKTLLQPYVDTIAVYNSQVVGQTTVPIDTLQAFTQETNGANLQADASVWELAQKDIPDVDFHLSGAMTNKLMAAGATPEVPVTLKISDMFAGMPYENSLVVMSMNGPQIKTVLERGYRNYYYYKYVPDRGGYSYYTTCMLDTNSIGQITYRDTFPALPDGNNVLSLFVDGVPIDFDDADTYYNVSTVNYLAAGSCNFNNAGVSLWPLNQIVHDTQYYVRDAVIDYIKAMGIISPMIEGRLVFNAAPELNTSQKSVTDASGDGLAQFGEVLTYAIDIVNTGGIGSLSVNDVLPGGLSYVDGSLQLPEGFTGDVIDNVLEASAENFPVGGTATITFAAQVTQALPYGESFSNQVLLSDQYASYSIPPAVIPMDKYYQLALTPPDSTKNGDPGSVVTYTLQLKNEGNLTDMITLDATSMWYVHLPTMVYTLASGSFAYVIVEVTIPPDAMAGDSDITTINATSSNGLTSTASLLTTVADQVFGVSLDPAKDAMNGSPGTTVIYTLHLTNGGNGTDEFTVGASGVWDTYLPTTKFTLLAGAAVDVPVRVTVPSDAMAGDSDIATITATSSDGVTLASSELTTTANQVFGIYLVPATDAKNGDPGTIVAYTLYLINAGNGTDVFTVAASGVWETFLPKTEFTLAAGDTTNVLVQVTVPFDAMAGDSDVATITATSSDGETSASSKLTTTANQIYAVALDPAMDAKNADPDTIVEYTLHLTNAGNASDEFTVVASSEWETFLPSTIFTLPAGSSADVIVRVTVPSDAMAGDSDVATITATSSDGKTSASSELTTTANQVYGFTQNPETDAKSGDPDTIVEYTLQLTNEGNGTDVFTVEALADWETFLPTTEFTLDPGETADVLVQVTVPSDAMAGDSDMATITTTSSDGETSASSELTTTANPVYGFTLSPQTDAKQGFVGEIVEYMLHLENTSNITETFSFSYTGNMWDITLPVTSVELGAGDELDILVEVTIPHTAAHKATDMVTITNTSAHDGAQEATLTTTSLRRLIILPLMLK